jgi:hypothetical protein
MALINEVAVRGGGSFLGTLISFVSMVVVMNTFSMFATSFLNRISFHNTIFQLGFLMSFGKNT